MLNLRFNSVHEHLSYKVNIHILSSQSDTNQFDRFPFENCALIGSQKVTLSIEYDPWGNLERNESSSCYWKPTHPTRMSLFTVSLVKLGNFPVQRMRTPNILCTSKDETKPAFKAETAGHG